jgi:hypothetical protein
LKKKKVKKRKNVNLKTAVVVNVGTRASGRNFFGDGRNNGRLLREPTAALYQTFVLFKDFVS